MRELRDREDVDQVEEQLDRRDGLLPDTARTEVARANRGGDHAPEAAAPRAGVSSGWVPSRIPGPAVPSVPMSRHAARAARDHCLAPGARRRPRVRRPLRRMFADLPPLAADEGRCTRSAAAGGACDVGPPTPRRRRRRASRRLAVLRPVRRARHHRRPLAAPRSAPTAQLRNFRTPAREPRGPLRRRARSARPTSTSATTPRSCSSAAGGNDVPRNQEGIALIGDPRNDVHLFINQLQVAFIGAHNLARRPAARGRRRRGGRVRRGPAGHDVALPVVILRDFLPTLIGAELTAELLDGRRRAATAPATSRTSRSSSPTPRTATATARSATATGSTRPSARSPSSPT